MSLRVSVVVPTYHRPDLLRRCLEALLAQDLLRCQYEIIVVDDAVCDTTRALVADLAALTADTALSLRYLRASHTQGPAAARNIGWRAARGTIIAFTDDDCIPEPEWLSAGVAAFKGDVAGVSGRVVVPLGPHPTDYELSEAKLEWENEFVTANCFYRRDLLAAVGGFDERFTAAWREDSDLLYTLMKQGCTLIFAPEAIVIHPTRPVPWGVHIFMQRKSMFNALLYKKHPALYRRYIQATPPWHYYRIVGTLLLLLGSLLKGAPRLAYGALAAWAVLTLQFSVQRLQNTSRAPGHVAEVIFTSICIPPLSIFWRLRGAIKFRVVFL